jgi:hypothetical protein
MSMNRMPPGEMAAAQVPSVRGRAALLDEAEQGSAGVSPVLIDLGRVALSAGVAMWLLSKSFSAG